ncbi:cell wall hydrolase [Pseudomonas agarici]|uniref:cell wall hydrolase n=2 Tax=Pseudomonas agarici TaxID=46677 RepID=UPI0008CF3A1A|nr:cell wall hydrolase [Pseudomonas agarici]NWB93828.1 cell wall hydrolase [Pseudomonas agarici]NWC09956.1 cell wall hydrolase [Pseudomonas agarici]SEL56007.1 Cell wall hydrolase CwlJ, involved in spore germination [Pseudomonas agarici]
MRLAWIASCLVTALATVTVIAGDPEPKPEVAIDKAQALEHKAAKKESPAAQPQAPTLTKVEAQAVDPAGDAAVADTITCLSRTIYWEAKGGGPADMEAVTSVVLNRLGHEGFPRTICEVVKQGSEQRVCQFSWWCDGRSDEVQEEGRYTIAKEIARKALNQQLKDRTHGALYFHDRSVTPNWVKQYIKTAETDKFLFYKPQDDKAK